MEFNMPSERLELEPAASSAMEGDVLCPDIYVVQPGDTYYGIAAKLGITAYQLSGLNPYVDPEALQVGQQLCIPLQTEDSFPAPTFAPTQYAEPEEAAPTFAEAGTYEAGYRDGDYPAGDHAEAVFAGEYGAEPTYAEPTYAEPRDLSTPAPIQQAPVNPPITIQKAPSAPAPQAEQYQEPLTAPTPSLTPCPTSNIRVTVPTGWDCAQILRRYNVSYQALADANPRASIDALTSGQLLCVPPSGSRGLCDGVDLSTYTMKSSDTLESIARQYGIRACDLLRANRNLAPSDFCSGRTICVPRE